MVASKSKKRNSGKRSGREVVEREVEVVYPIPHVGPNDEPLCFLKPSEVKALIGCTCSYWGWEDRWGGIATIIGGDGLVALIRDGEEVRPAAWADVFIRPRGVQEQLATLSASERG